jgi:hypothetical protein
VEQPEFREGRFDTTYLDRVLAERHGRPFQDPTPADETHASVAVSVAAWLRAHRAAAGATTDAASAWRRAARREALQ